jgi:hypothetical protein
MDAELVRAYADEVAWLTARLNRRAAELEGMDPDSGEFRDAIRVADFLVGEITAALRSLLANGSSLDQKNSAR